MNNPPSLNEKMLLDILAHSKEATVVFISKELHIGFINKAMMGLWNKQEIILHKPLIDVAPEFEPFFPILQHVWNSGEPYLAVERPANIDHNGELVETYFDFEYRPILDENGHTYAIINTATDVTDRRESLKLVREKVKSEQSLLEALNASNEELSSLNEEYRASNEELAAINEEYQKTNHELNFTQYHLEETNLRLNFAMEAGGLGSTEVEFATGQMQASEQFKKNYGRTADQDFTYADLFDSILPEYREQVREKVQKAIKTHTIYTAEYPIRWPDGSLHWIGAFGKPRYDETGNATRIVGLTSDITDQVTARIQLEQAEAKLRLATEAASLGTWYINAETLEFIPSGRLKELFGYRADEIMPYEAAVNQIAESHRSKVADAVNAAIKEGRSYDIEYPLIGYRDQQLRWVRATGRLFEAKGAEPAHFSGAMIDITEQINALQAIQESEERYRKLAENLKISEDETQLAIDAASLATFDLNPSTGKFKGNHLIKEWFGLQPDEEIDLENATNVIAETDRKKVIAAIQDALNYDLGGNYDISYTIINPLEPTPRIVKAKGATLFNQNREPVRLSGVLQDVTEQKQDEQRKNDFIAMVSHELKTPLTSLLGYVQMSRIIAKKQQDQKLADMLDKSQVQVKKMNTMITGFLDMSRFEAGKIYLKKQDFLLNELVAEIVSDTLLISATHEISYLQGEDIKVNADRDKIGQVISNLISNAIKYSPPGSPIVVCCKVELQKAVVSVSDQGMGISGPDMEKLFDRFYRVTGQHADSISGFGIGLYLSAEIMERHNGRIWVESELGKGSTFYFSLDFAESENLFPEI